MQHAFLDAVLPAEGLRVVASKPPKYKSGFRHEFFETNDQLVQRTTMLDEDHVTNYFALASYNDPEAGRTAENTLQLKSFWIDLDFKQYKSSDEITTDIQKVIDRIGPPTFIVNSGGGLHLYWAFDCAIDTNEWEPLAVAFQATWQDLGVLADPVSIDAARVLRLPGTHNRKPEYDAPRLVHIINSTGRTYDPYDLAEHFVEVPVHGHFIPLARGLQVPPILRHSFDDLTDGMEHRDSHFGPILDKCAQVQFAWQNPDDVIEPVWYAVLQLVRHTVDGEAHAHAISEGHHDYTEQATDKKLAALEAKDVGPTTCDRFRALHPAVCQGCPHKVTSPIVLGHEDAPPPSPEPEIKMVEHTPTPTGEVKVVEHTLRPAAIIPADSGFDYDAGYIYRRVRGSDGEYSNIAIFHGFIYPERLETDAHNNYETTIKLYVQSADQPPRRIHIPNKALADKRGLSNELKGKGVNFMAKNAGHLLDLLEVMVGDLESRRENSPVINQMGWQDDGSFVIGTTGYRQGVEPEPDLPALPPIRHTAPLFEPAGTLEGWKRVAEVYNRPGGEVYQFALCYGAAGLLLPDTTHSGVVLSLYSRESGQGKTTVGYGALSWWGNPERLKSQASDTNNALYNKASRSKNLPIVIDEITEKPVREFSDVVYHMSLGREKERLASDATPRQTLPPWTLPVITTSNVAIKPMLQDHRGDAQGMFARIFEVSLSGPFAASATPDDKDILRDGFTRNYGLAGPVLLRYVLENREAIERARRQFARVLNEASGGNNAHRFWVASCSAALTVAAAARSCGLLNYDLQALSNWAVRMITTQHQESEALIATADEILARFLADNVNTLLTRYMRKAGAGLLQTAYWPEDGVRGPRLSGLVDITTGRLFIARWHLARYCRDAGYDVDGFFADAYQMQDLDTGIRLLTSTKPKQVSLGEGTRTASARTEAMEFDLRHPALAEFASHHDKTIQTAEKLRSIK